MLRAKRSRRGVIVVIVVVLALLAPVLLFASFYRQERRNVALIAAIHRKDSGAALALIRQGANPNVIDSGPRMITLTVVWQRMLDRFHGLPTAHGPSALDLAVRANLSSVACALLDSGATGANDRIAINVDNAEVRANDDDEMCSLFQVAVSRRDCNLAGRLILRGLDINERNSFGQTPLLMAASNEDLATVTLLLAHHADPNSDHGNDGLPLIAALDHRSVNPVIVKELLDHGANPNGDGDKCIPLMHTDDPDTMAAIIAHGADVRMSEHNGWSPIFSAAVFDNRRGLRLLLEHGAGINDRDRSGDTPLLCAADCGADEVAFLLERGATVNSKDAVGRTALMRATEASSLGTVRLLLAHGATVTLRDRDGRTALFIAASNRDTEMTTALIHAGSPLNTRDVIGETALDEAEDAENGKAAAVLRAAGAHSGRSPGRIPAIARILGLRLGYTDEFSLHEWTIHADRYPNRYTWKVNDAAVEIAEHDRDTRSIVALDVLGWHGRLRSNTAFRQHGCGPWGDMRIGMTLADARAVLRSKLPPPTVKPGGLTWTAHAHGRRAGKSVPFTYTATLRFGDGLKSLHLEVAAPE